MKTERGVNLGEALGVGTCVSGRRVSVSEWLVQSGWVTAVCVSDAAGLRLWGVWDS